MIKRRDTNMTNLNRTLLFMNKQVTHGIEVVEIGKLELQIAEGLEPMDVIMQATTEWVSKTEEGTALFKDVGGKVDFVAMLDRGGFESPKFQSCLKEGGAQIVAVEMVDQASIFDMNHNLVDNKLLLKLGLHPQESTVEKSAEEQRVESPFSFGPR